MIHRHPSTEVNVDLKWQEKISLNSYITISLVSSETCPIFNLI